MWLPLGGYLKLFCMAAVQPQHLKTLVWVIIAVLFGTLWWQGRNATKRLAEAENEIDKLSGARHDQSGLRVFVPNPRKSLELLAKAMRDVSALSGLASLVSCVAAVASAFL